jgi:hypothetical protein
MVPRIPSLGLPGRRSARNGVQARPSTRLPTLELARDPYQDAGRGAKESHGVRSRHRVSPAGRKERNARVGHPDPAHARPQGPVKGSQHLSAAV